MEDVGGLSRLERSGTQIRKPIAAHYVLDPITSQIQGPSAEYGGADCVSRGQEVAQRVQRTGIQAPHPHPHTHSHPPQTSSSLFCSDNVVVTQV